MTFHLVDEGDCRERLASMPDAFFDAIATDPPYGLRFMDKAWDHEVPGAPFWSAFLRVMKPGAWCVAFGGTRKWHRLACAIEDGGWEIRDTLEWMYGQGYPKTKHALKPGHEPIILARAPGPMRPLNIDACRIEVRDQKGNHRLPTDRSTRRDGTGADFSMSAGDPLDGKGRWPANVILDEEAAAELDAQTGVLVSGNVKKTYSSIVQTSVALGAKRRDLHPGKVFADAGGASRFFYVAKAAKSERTHEGTIENKHSTVKPVALMAWLARLITPPGGVVLDPFVGSGTTLVACTQEGFSCVGIEKDPESAATARARLCASKTKMARPAL